MTYLNRFLRIKNRHTVTYVSLLYLIALGNSALRCSDPQTLLKRQTPIVGNRSSKRNQKDTKVIQAYYKAPDKYDSNDENINLNQFDQTEELDHPDHIEDPTNESIDPASPTAKEAIKKQAKAKLKQWKRLMCKMLSDIRLDNSLHRAIQSGKLEAVQILMERIPKDVNKQKSNGFTPLHTAVLVNNLYIVKYLIEKGAAINTSGKVTPLHIALTVALTKDNWEIVEYLIKAGANVNIASNDGMMPLHSIVANTDNLAIAKLLIERGATINATDNIGMTPLHYAAWSRKIDMIKCLCTNALIDDPILLEVKNKHGNRTPLQIAIFFDASMEIISYLLNTGADKEVRDWLGETPLHTAIGVKRFDLVKCLVEAGAALDAKDNDGQIPLTKAIMTHQAAIKEYLIEVEATRSKVSGFTPLHIAAWHNDIKLAQYLVKYAKIDINAQDGHGRTALHIAAPKGHLEIVRLLIDKDAKVDVLDKQDKTPYALTLPIFENLHLPTRDAYNNVHHKILLALAFKNLSKHIAWIQR